MTGRKARISKRVMDTLSPGEVVWDTEVKGFGVRCQRRDKVYVLKTRIAGRQRWFSIGPHGSPWNPEKARAKALSLLGAIAAGANPASVRDAERLMLTVKELAERFLEEHSAEHKRESSYEADERNVRNHINPLLGKYRAADLKRADIDWFMRSVKDGKTAKDEMRGKGRRSIVKGGPGAANRCVALLSKMLNWAETIGQREGGSNPCRHIKKYKERSIERFLSDEELSSLATVLSDAEQAEARAAQLRDRISCEADAENRDALKARLKEAEVAAESPYVVAAVRLLILTGARLSEILSLRWSYVDFRRAMLFLPDSKTGQKVIYLSGPALAVLSEIPRLAGDERVVPIVNIQKPWRRVRSAASVAVWRKTPELVSIIERLEVELHREPTALEVWRALPAVAKLIAALTKEKGSSPSARQIITAAQSRNVPIPVGLMDLRIHDLRHSYASVGTSGGLSLPIIGRLLGHTAAATTQRYAHLAADPVRAANEAIGQKIAATMKGVAAEVVELPKRRA